MFMWHNTTSDLHRTYWDKVNQMEPKKERLCICIVFGVEDKVASSNVEWNK